jgi:hypothetical protein
MKNLLFTLSLLLISTNACAQWTFYSKSEEGVEFMYDKSSVKRNGDKVKVWVYYNANEVSNNKETGTKITRSWRSLNEIDCVNDTTKKLSLHIFEKPNLKGEPVDLTDPNPKITYISPGSTNSILMKLACKK